MIFENSFHIQLFFSISNFLFFLSGWRPQPGDFGQRRHAVRPGVAAPGARRVGDGPGHAGAGTVVKNTRTFLKSLEKQQCLMIFVDFGCLFVGCVPVFCFLEDCFFVCGCFFLIVFFFDGFVIIPF